MERCNVRDLGHDHLGGRRVDAIVCDISFISLRLALPAALALAEAQAWGLFLVKPQFEVGRAHIGKNGVVRDPQEAQRCLGEIATWLADVQGWSVIGTLPAPLTGGDGNQEYLLAERKGEPAEPDR